MVMPIAGRIVAAVIGGLLVLLAGSSVVGTLIVTRSVASRLTRSVDWIVDRAYQLATRHLADYKDRDRVLATQAAAILLLQLAAWLGVAYVGFALLLWPFATRGWYPPLSTPGPRCSPWASPCRPERCRRCSCSWPRRPGW